MNLPKLRFKEFSDSWNKFSLNDISLKIQDGTHFSPEVFESGDYKYLTSKNVKNGYIDLSNLSYISEKAHNEIYKRCDVREGDVLLTKDGTIGQVCVNTLSEPFSLLSSVAFIRTKNSFNNYFLYHLLLSPYGQQEINKSIAGQALKRITLTKINSYIYSFPCTQEQTKIADFLTAIDEKITQLTQKHSLLTQYKKGVMQKIFSQELRFKDDDGQDFPEWVGKKLEDLAEKIGSGGTPKSTITEYYDGDIPWVSIADMTSSGKFISDTKRKITTLGLKESSARLYPEGVVLFAMYASIGEVALAKVPVTTSQAILSIKPKNALILNEYLYFWLLSLKEKIVLMGQQGAQSNLNLDLVKNFLILLPALTEQEKIANFLSAIDEKITATQSQLEAVKQYKQGLLQQMFI